MNVQIDSALKHARGYWFVERIYRNGGRRIVYSLGGDFLFSGNASQATFPHWFLSITGEIVIAKLIGMLAAILILWWLKDHFTYPCTGFVRGQTNCDKASTHHH